MELRAGVDFLEKMNIQPLPGTEPRSLDFPAPSLHYGDKYIIRSFMICTPYRGTAVAQWLRCCATNRKVAGLIPAGVSGFFIDIKSFR